MVYYPTLATGCRRQVGQRDARAGLGAVAGGGRGRAAAAGRV